VNEGNEAVGGGEIAAVWGGGQAEAQVTDAEISLITEGSSPDCLSLRHVYI